MKTNTILKKYIFQKHVSSDIVLETGAAKKLDKECEYEQRIIIFFVSFVFLISFTQFPPLATTNIFCFY